MDYRAFSTNWGSFVGCPCNKSPTFLGSTIRSSDCWNLQEHACQGCPQVGAVGGLLPPGLCLLSGFRRKSLSTALGISILLHGACILDPCLEAPVLLTIHGDLKTTGLRNLEHLWKVHLHTPAHVWCSQHVVL